MNVAVVGLWHLGCVTAASLAAAGHAVVGIDPDVEVVARLRQGKAPILEPGLDELIAHDMSAGRLTFETDSRKVAGCGIVWIAYDTPVDEDDRADVESVVQQVERLFPHLDGDALVLISSQLPVGTTARLEQAYRAGAPNGRVTFAYSPENLRLGKALAAFREPDRVVVGVRTTADRGRITELLKPVTSSIEWMSVESAEMTKHALNAFLATSVVFANEIGVLCEAAGADAAEVERGLKTESRIGSRAYLAPGPAFAGGTLARDLQFLIALGGRGLSGRSTLLAAARESNTAHARWAEQRLARDLGELKGRRIAVWGLTYKPGTDTLRRSLSVELCRRLHAQGAHVRAHDPAIQSLPADLAASIELARDPVHAVEGAAALIAATPWPEYRAVSTDRVVEAMKNPYVLDAARFLAASLGQDARVRYVTVGRGGRP